MTTRAAVDALRGADQESFARHLERDPGLARDARVVIEAARAGSAPALRLLAARGADWNVMQRGYRPLHALMQEKPDGAPREATPERLRCLRLLLDRGADPELPAAWPPARALVIAAFLGEKRYVDVLRLAGARIDGFTGAALGDRASVKRALTRDPDFASARDAGGLTALHIAAGSRMGVANAAVRRRLREVVERLLDAGADPRAAVRSLGRDVDVATMAAGGGDGAILELIRGRE